MRTARMLLSSRRVAAGALMGTVVAMVACAGDPEQQGPLSGLEQDFVRAAYAQEPPYAFLDSSGVVTGESPIALRGALDALGVDSIRWLRMSFDELLPALEAGRVDVVASGLYPTEERRARALFTRSTSCSGAALAVRSEPSAPSALQELAGDSPLRLAVLRGAVEERAAAALDISPARLVVVPDVDSGLDAVRQGLADAFALTEPTLRHALPEGGTLRVVPYEPPEAVAGMVSGCSALAVGRDAVPLGQMLDRGLGIYVGSDAHRRLVEPLGFSVPDPVMRATSPDASP